MPDSSVARRCLRSTIRGASARSDRHTDHQREQCHDCRQQQCGYHTHAQIVRNW